MICHTFGMESKKGMQRVSDLGPTGDTVRARIAAERGRLNLSYAELSRRLAAVGRPITTLALRRIEAGARRVDVDDLVALALVLGATPNSLLMDPADANPEFDTLTAITGQEERYAREAWEWLSGRWPAYDEDEGELVFFQRNQPPGARLEGATADKDIQARLTAIESQIRSLNGLR